MKIQFIFKWYDIWIGFFYDKKKKWIYFLPLPMIGVIIKLPERQNKKFNCYEWKPNIPFDGCKTQCKECAELDKQLYKK
jgi:hypothetical protein